MTVIEVFADVCCTYTHVGLRRLVAFREASGRTDVVLRVRAWPLEFVNDGPLRADKVGGQIEVLRSGVAPDLFTGFDPVTFPTTFPATSVRAFNLTAAAYRVSDERGEQMALGLRSALFERGLDISAPAVLAGLAADHGVGWADEVDPAAVRADWAEGQARGVVGSPHFFVGDHDFFCPTLAIGRVDGELRIEFDPVAFEGFVETAFGQTTG